MQFSIVFPLLVVVLASCDRKFTPAALPSTINLTASEGLISKVPQGRYTLIPVNGSGGTFIALYVIDSQTGRVWCSSLDSAHNVFVLRPVIYKNIDGATSTLPNENLTDVLFKDEVHQRRPAPEEAQYAKSQGIAPEGFLVDDTNPATIIPDTRLVIKYAIKDTSIWKEQLEQVKSGRAIKSLEGWDDKGNPVYGVEVQPSPKLVNDLTQWITNSQSIMEQKTLLLNQLETKTP